VAQVVVFEGL